MGIGHFYDINVLVVAHWYMRRVKRFEMGGDHFEVRHFGSNIIIFDGKRVM